MLQGIIVYLNLYEVSSLQIQEKSKTPTTYKMELFVTLFIYLFVFLFIYLFKSLFTVGVDDSQS